MIPRTHLADVASADIQKLSENTLGTTNYSYWAGDADGPCLLRRRLLTICVPPLLVVVRCVARNHAITDTARLKCCDVDILSNVTSRYLVETCKERPSV